MRKDLSISELAKKYANRKTILGALALVSGIAIISLFTFVPYTWDPARLFTGGFLTDTLTNAAITILGMVCMLFIAQTMNANNAASKISEAMREFKATKERISDRHAFKQWVKRVQQPKDLNEIKERMLSSVGVEDMRLLGLSESEVKGLLDAAQKYDGRFYAALDKRQVRMVLAIKRGVRVKFPAPEVYLTAKSVLDDRTPSERLSNEGSKKRNFAVISIASKVVMVFMLSMIFTMFVRDVAGQSDPLTAAGKFAVRMMNMLSSSFMGFIVGGQLNDIDAEYVNLRVEVFNDYLTDKEFVPQSAEDEAKEEFKARVAKEQVLALPEP